MKYAVAMVLAIVAAPTLIHAKVLFREDFEGDQSLALQLVHTNDGDLDDIKVHHLGLSDEQAVSGKRSFKVDLTVNSGDDVHCTIPVDFPFSAVQDLKVEAKLRVEGATTTFGFYYRIPAARLSGLVQRGKKQQDLSSSWWSCLAQEPRLYKSAVPVAMSNLALYIRPLPGTEPSRFIEDRVVVYVDDIVVTAIPRHIEESATVGLDKIDGYRLYPVKTITNQKILASRPEIPADVRLKAMKLTAAGDEFESASFAILAAEELKDVTINMAPFSNGADEISSFDVWAIKCWYQPHLDDDQFGPIVPTLTSELLLHDDDLVRVDIKAIKQHVRATTPDGNEEFFDITGPNSDLKEAYLIDDAPSLLPVTIREWEPKQFWITVYVSPEVPPGEYKSTIRVQPQNAPPQMMPVTLTVLPFRLPPPCLEYSLYYNASAKGDDIPIVSQDYKTDRQLEAEFHDMKAHGVINPNMRDGGNVERYLAIRNKVGMSRDRLFFQHSPHSSSDEQLRRKMETFKRFGYEEVYLVGFDEATGDRLVKQRSHWERAHSLGFKMFVACNEGFFPLVGDILDAPVFGGRPKPDLAAKVKANGFRIYVYANPQFGQPNPETYRRNYGLALWKAGYSGVMNYAYQHSMTQHMWNDMAAGIQDRVTYATSSGVVGTMAWEGFREAVDDVRYLTLLLDLSKNLYGDDGDTERSLRAWLDGLDPLTDLDEVRAELCAKIGVLMGA